MSCSVSIELLSTIFESKLNIDSNVHKYNKDELQFDRNDIKMDENDQTIDKKDINIFRFKFTDTFMTEIHNFSKIHQYDSRHDFKEAWELWIIDNDSLIDSETSRLKTLGYDGNIVDKMYKSSRYYFRNKSTIKTQTCPRRKYVNLDNKLLHLMDEHIRLNIKKNGFQPKTGFKTFCDNNQVVLKEAINLMLKNGFNDSKMMEEKIKKTYKNRYCIFTNK